MNCRNKIAASLIFSLLAALGLGRDIYVATNGAGGGDPLYGAWVNASSNIQWAVNVGTNGDNIWISNGTYYLTNQVTVNSNITISGNRGELVVVNGNGANRCFNFPSTANKVGVLSNLFITGGATNGHGGGVYMSYRVVLDCVFSNNINNIGGGLNNVGGGMYFVNTGTVQRCRFIANVASSNGGGLYTASYPLIYDCVFHTNISGCDGGGMYNYHASTIITNSRLTCNVASNKGGGAVFRGIMTRCTIASNIAVNSHGGGVYVWGLLTNCYMSNNISIVGCGGGVGQSSASTGIKNCLIARNKSLNAVGNVGGGGVYLNGLIKDCIIEGNTSPAGGGGIFIYGGTLRNCLIRNNVASYGGGFRRDGGGSISDCTIVSNYATSSTTGGGGIYDANQDEGPQYDNCIIYFNKYNNSGSASNYYFTTGHFGSSFSNCCFAPELPAGITSKSTNSITADPQFVNWPGGNYRLSKGSPCVNTGVNRDWMTDAVDLGGRPRIDRYSGIVDMGCYEHIPSGMMFGVR